MRLTRRALLGTASAALLAPRRARADTVTDDAGRAVQAPAKVQRVYPAGLPAAILLYMLAPDLLLGWPRVNRPQDCAYMLPDICARPQLARITGRGDTAKLETVAALKPDLILDVGSTGPRYVALADRVQQQTGIPYALLSGNIMSLSTSYGKLGRLIGREAAGADFDDYCNMTLGVITNRIAFVPASSRPRIYSARGPRGLTTALGGSSSCGADRTRRAQRRRRPQRRIGRGDGRADSAMESGRYRDDQSRFRGRRPQRSRLGFDQSVARGPRAPDGRNPVRLVRRSAVGQPPDRVVVACKDSLSGSVQG